MSIIELIAGAKSCAKARGKGRTAFYDEIRAGLMTRPFANGARAVAWPRAEVEAINKARIAGKSNDEIRALVAELHAARKAG